VTTYRVEYRTLSADPLQAANCPAKMVRSETYANPQAAADFLREWVKGDGPTLRQATMYRFGRGCLIPLLRAWMDYQGAYHESREDGK
jgi:hypothetical protein